MTGYPIADGLKSEASVNIVYVVGMDGHRGSYANTLGKELGLTSCVGAPSLSISRKLFFARRLLFATMEDSPVFFIFISYFRSVIGKPTAALFMNPRTWFEPDTFKTRLKQFIFKRLNARPAISMLSILPHSLDMRHKEISRDWVYDPEFWDLVNTTKYASTLSHELVAQLGARGSRRMVLFAGRIDQTKGFDFFVEGIRRLEKSANAPAPFFVAAGKVSPESIGQAENFKELGGILIDRFVDDNELFALQRSADCIWACYHPSYNSSSGIFGRSMQFGKNVIISESFFLDQIAAQLGYPAIRCVYGNTAQLGKIFSEIANDSVRSPTKNKMIKEIRVDALLKLHEALGYR